MVSPGSSSDTTRADTRQFTVMLCTRSRGGMRAVVEAYRDEGLFARRRVRLIDTHDEGTLLGRLAIAAQALAIFTAMLVRREVALVHAHIAMRGSFWRKSIFLALARRFGVPVVAHLHGSDFQIFVAQQPAWRRRMVVNQLQRADRVLVLGQRWRDYVLSIAPGARVQVLPNSVRMPDAVASHAPRDTVELLFLGIVGERKGVYDLLQAMAGVLRENPAVRLTIGGNGAVAKAQAMALQLGLGDCVRFAGWVDGAAKRTLLQASDAYVLPSHNEGLPISILEAMSWQLPIISTDVGAIAELVRHGQDGWIVQPGDVPALKAAILALAGSASLRREMGARARVQVADHFSEPAVLPQLERCYDELLAGRTAGRRSF